jgi:alpha-1,2-mannosyltransferase
MGLAVWSRTHRTPLVLFALTFVVFALTATRDFVSQDVWTTNLASWRLAVGHSPNVDGVSITSLDGSPVRWVWIADDAPNGHTVITRAPGAVWAGVPAYLILHPASMTLLPGALTAALMMALATVLMYRALGSLMRDWQAAGAALVFAFTTPVWSVAANGVWPQTVTVLAIALVAWAAVRERWWLMGIGGAMLVSARPHAGLIVATVGLAMAWQERRVGAAARVAIPGVVALALMCGWTEWVYGSWNPMVLFGAGSFQQVHQSLLDLPNQAAMWAAPDRGLFVYTPVLLLLLPTLLRVRRQLPLWVSALFVGGLAYTLVQSAMINYTGGDPIYGYRYGLEFLACATPAFAVAATRAGPRTRRLLLPVVTLQFTVISLGAVVEHAALPYRFAAVDNAFFRDLVDGFPGLPIITASVASAFVLGVRAWFTNVVPDQGRGIEKSHSVPSGPVANLHMPPSSSALPLMD